MPTQQQLIAAGILADAVLECQRRTGYPFPDIQMAIVIFESNWLDKAPGFNCAGIKAHGTLATQLLATHEWFSPVEAQKFIATDPRRTCVMMEPTRTDVNGRHDYVAEDVFCSYPSIAECLVDQVQYFLTGGLTGASAWMNYTENGDKDAYVKAVCSHYSDTASYAAQITAEASAATVQNALQAARARVVVP